MSTFHKFRSRTSSWHCYIEYRFSSTGFFCVFFLFLVFSIVFSVRWHLLQLWPDFIVASHHHYLMVNTFFSFLTTPACLTLSSFLGSLQGKDRVYPLYQRFFFSRIRECFGVVGRPTDLRPQAQGTSGKVVRVTIETSLEPLNRAWKVSYNLVTPNFIAMITHWTTDIPSTKIFLAKAVHV